MLSRKFNSSSPPCWLMDTTHTWLHTNIFLCQHWFNQGYIVDVDIFGLNSFWGVRSKLRSTTHRIHPYWQISIHQTNPEATTSANAIPFTDFSLSLYLCEKFQDRREEGCFDWKYPEKEGSVLRRWWVWVHGNFETLVYSVFIR